MMQCQDDRAKVVAVLGTLLRKAAGDGCLSLVKAILNEGCPVGIVDSNGWSALHYAAQHGSVEVIRELLSKECDINAIDNYGRTPLHVAAVGGKTKAALELIRQRAEKAIGAGAIGTPLHQAVALGHMSTVKAMLEAGCPVNAIDSRGLSVLHFAALGDNVEVIREVLSNGCSINATDNEGRTPLHVAAVKGNTKVALELIRLGADRAKVGGKHVSTPLHHAAVFGQVLTLKAMLKEGCPANAVDGTGASILHYAAQRGNVEAIRTLLNRQSDINAVDDNGESPLHVAACEGNTDAALELIKFGAKKDIFSSKFGTPLHRAALSGCVKIVRAMLKEGCLVDVVDGKGASVMHYAAEGGNAEVIRELLSMECDINAKAINGTTPLHVAAAVGKTKAALELIRQGAEKDIFSDDLGTPLHQAAAHDHVSTVKAMLMEGCSVNAVVGNRYSVLHCAALYGHDKVIEELLSKGCDVNPTDNRGNTPLDVAAKCGFEKTVLKLVEHGADKTRAGGTFGRPVLAAAAGGHWKIVEMMMKQGFPVKGVTMDGKTIIHVLSMGGEARLLRLLAERRFHIDQQDVYGLTPLHYAVSCQNLGCIKALLELGANTVAEAPLLGTPLNVLRIFYADIRRPDELIVDFALCKKLGIKIESPYIFSKHGGTISMFETILFLNSLDMNKVRVPNKLKQILTVFSRHQLIDLNNLVCLAAIHGDVLVLECLSEILKYPIKPGHFYHHLKQLFPVPFKQSDSLLQQVLPECELNPLQLAIIAMRYTKGFYHVCMYCSSCKYDEVISVLTTRGSFRYFLNDCLPNGLSPLDLAKRFGLDKAVTIITGAGGRHGIWAELPQEVNEQHGSAILRIYQELMKLESSGSLGQQAVQAVLSQIRGKTITAEQGISTEESHLYEQKVLNHRPELPVIVRVVLPKVDVGNWEEVGIRLGVPTSTLVYLEHDQARLRDRYRKVLSYWLEHNDAASWRVLLQVIGHYETKHTMEQLTQDILATEGSEVQTIFTAPSVPLHCPVVNGAPTPTPPSSQLSPQFLSHVVYHVGVKWYDFALYLDVSSTVLDVIEVQKRDLISDCCHESLHCWLRHDRGTGWKRREVGVVLEAVEKACGQVAVEQIQSSLQGRDIVPVSSAPLLQSTPELATLREHVVPFAAAQWEAVADYLLVSYEKRAAIATSKRGHVEVCCRELFNQWLQRLPGTGSLPRTWGVVLDKVGDAVGPEVAKQIMTRLDPKEEGTSSTSPCWTPLRDNFLDSKPTAVPLLKKVVPSVASKWLQLGVHLGMEAAILKTFKATESQDVNLCCLEMFEYWLQEARGTGESPRTWSSVLSAVEDCVGHDVADSIEGALLEDRHQRK